MTNAAELLTENQLLKKQIEKRDALISVLEEKLRLLDMARFAAKSEKAAIDQLGLFDEAELLTSVEAEKGAADTTSVKSHQRSSKPRVSIPQDLPREEIVYDVAEADKQCL